MELRKQQASSPSTLSSVIGPQDLNATQQLVSTQQPCPDFPLFLNSSLFLFFLLSFVEVGAHYVALAILKLAM